MQLFQHFDIVRVLRVGDIKMDTIHPTQVQKIFHWKKKIHSEREGQMQKVKNKASKRTKMAAS